jgi:hypothetical protein
LIIVKKLSKTGISESLARNKKDLILRDLINFFLVKKRN